MDRGTFERVILDKAMEYYDGASNGNKTRGGVKRANDVIAAFRPQFPRSDRFRQVAALIAATHALSFYSLALQHGVPFQPVSIRVSQDPIGLIDKVLEQNPRSYTKLDDLIAIADNLVSAGPTVQIENMDVASVSQEQNAIDRSASQSTNAERRVTFMAVEAALREDDFETAYSYIVNRLNPGGTDAVSLRDTSTSESATHLPRTVETKAVSNADDMSWRAAFLAGRYRPAASSPPTLRRLEQRMELLSLALLLAPTPALTDILAAWRRCEEETTSLQRAQQQAEEEFDDRADKRQSTSALPGNFTVQAEQPVLLLNQKRREMGRMSGKTSEGDAPMSMFDLTRSAAQAFSKNAFPLRSTTQRSSQDGAGMESSIDSLGSHSMSSFGHGVGGDEQQRVRKRDMVANAVSGGLASGLGWVLGATPVNQQQQQHTQEH